MRTTTALALAGALMLTGCSGDSDPFAEPDAEEQASGSPAGDEPAESGPEPEQAGGEIAIGSANFPENVLLAEIYAAALSDAGFDVSVTANIGSRETYFAGLQDGSIDLIPEYLGGLATYLNPETTAVERDELIDEIDGFLPEELQILAVSEAENKDAIVVTGDTAQELGLVQIGDLVEHADQMSLGGPPEFATRPNGVDGLAEVYDVRFGEFRSLSAGANLTVQSLINGQVDAANIFTTDPAIEENGFVVLDDPESLFAAQNVVPLVSRSVLDAQVQQVLDGISAALTTEALTAMNVVVMSQGREPGQVAREFVDQFGGAEGN